MKEINYAVWRIDKPHGKTLDFWLADSRRGIAKGGDPLEALQNLLIEEYLQNEAEWAELLGSQRPKAT